MLAIAFPSLHLHGLRFNYPSMTDVRIHPSGFVQVKYGQGRSGFWVVIDKESSLLKGIPPEVVDLLHDLCWSLHRKQLEPGVKLSYLDVMGGYASLGKFLRSFKFRWKYDDAKSSSRRKSTNKRGV